MQGFGRFPDGADGRRTGTRDRDEAPGAASGVGLKDRDTWKAADSARFRKDAHAFRAGLDGRLAGRRTTFVNPRTEGPGWPGMRAARMPLLLLLLLLTAIFGATVAVPLLLDALGDGMVGPLASPPFP